MITFVDLDGTRRTGEVWSPGPLPNSVWVLLGDGTSVAVSLPTDTKPARRAVVFEQDPLGRDRAVAVPYCVHRHGGPILARQSNRLAARSAPPLTPKAWRAAVGDQALV